MGHPCVESVFVFHFFLEAPRWDIDLCIPPYPRVNNTTSLLLPLSPGPGFDPASRGPEGFIESFSSGFYHYTESGAYYCIVVKALPGGFNTARFLITFSEDDDPGITVIRVCQSVNISE